MLIKKKPYKSIELLSDGNEGGIIITIGDLVELTMLNTGEVINCSVVKIGNKNVEVYVSKETYSRNYYYSDIKSVVML